MRYFAIGFLAAAGCGLAQAPGANYDEAKVGTYHLPDPLKLQSGAPVKDAATWKVKRRPEILKLYEDTVYGRTPAPKKIEYEVTSQVKNALGGQAARKEVTIWVAGRKAPAMQLLLYLPAGKTRVPVFLGLNFGGNQTINADPGITITKSWVRPPRHSNNTKADASSRGSAASRWQVETVLAHGYGVATVYYGDIFPDRTDGIGDSIIPHFYKPGQTARSAEDWNAIGAWAYGLSRALDYLEKDPDVDAKRVAVHGHSRLGKTSLWAGAQDERFALVISNDSGEGGAALSRRNFGETVERINTVFPHWFNDNYKKYNTRVNELPVDQHMLIALIAPRPVYIASAQEDQWADPRGEFLAGQAADPVYRLLGTDGLDGKQWPGIHQPVMSRIGYHIRAGKHDVTEYDWEQFIKFADKHMRAK
ncbi:MAG: acetylxylan esterase [Bryobacterales bacterium]|nr:acetylxylan esterase [Bryobacterales bacterium]